MMNENNNEAELEWTSCPICNSSKSFDLTSMFAISENPAVTCKDCGCVYLNPRHTKSWYQEYYLGNHTRGEDNKRRGEIEVYEKRQYDKGRALHKYLESHIENFDVKNEKILELGCTSGGILRYFGEQGAKKTVGLDPEPAYVAYAQEINGIDVYKGFISDFKTQEKFTLIIMRHVVEHLLDPLTDLKIAREFLDEDGLILIETPSLYSINITGKWRENFRIEHPIVFSYKTLGYLIGLSGFDIVKSPINGNRSHIRFIGKKNHSQTLRYRGDQWLLLILKNIGYNLTTAIRKKYYNFRNNRHKA